ncbi:hypothetical protein EMVG_00189 [Emiliania huxleyi virus PS401]|nr:hypothetical protein EMVG_00189 [Emiliania huxleyi virus PS401]
MLLTPVANLPRTRGRPPLPQWSSIVYSSITYFIEYRYSIASDRAWSQPSPPPRAGGGVEGASPPPTPTPLCTAAVWPTPVQHPSSPPDQFRATCCVL